MLIHVMIHVGISFFNTYLASRLRLESTQIKPGFAALATSLVQPLMDSQS